MKKVVLMVMVLVIALSSFGKGVEKIETDKSELIRSNPALISYQGKILDSENSPVADGSYKVKFKLYESEDGKSSVWEEDQELLVNNGVLITELGINSNFNPTIFENQLYLSIVFDGEESERSILTGSAYSMFAKRVSEDAIIGGNGITVDKLEDGRLEISGALSGNFLDNTNGTKGEGIRTNLHVTGNATVDGYIYANAQLHFNQQNTKWKQYVSTGQQFVLQTSNKTYSTGDGWSHRFQIDPYGNVLVTGELEVENNISAEKQIHFKNSGKDWYWKQYMTTSSNYSNSLIFQTGNHPTHNGWNCRLQLEPDGDLFVTGDGLFNKDLYCKGTIETTELIVKADVTFPDYVFEDDYDMKSLYEVEDYIEENGHLPGMPSAEEVSERGMDITQIQLKLVEKVEELTLHMIELKKENEQLKQQLNK